QSEPSCTPRPKLKPQPALARQSTARTRRLEAEPIASMRHPGDGPGGESVPHAEQVAFDDRRPDDLLGLGERPLVERLLVEPLCGRQRREMAQREEDERGVRWRSHGLPKAVAKHGATLSSRRGRPPGRYCANPCFPGSAPRRLPLSLSLAPTPQVF